MGGGDRFNAHVLDVSEEDALRHALARVGVQQKGRPILTRKGRFYAVRLEGVGYREALIAKQEMLGAGGDAATPKELVERGVDRVDLLLLGTPLQFRRFLPKMETQPWDGPRIAAEVKAVLENYERRTFTLAHPGGTLTLDRPLVMGVLNVTPDSFSDGGHFFDPKAAIARGETMADEGAALLDVGAESTRPGIAPISAAEEWRRLQPVLAGLLDRVTVPLSVDTYKPETAAKALDLGAHMVNDVTGLRDPKMIQVVADHDVPVVLMHMQGTPQTMQENPEYGDVIGDILRYLRDRLAAAVEGGVAEEKTLVDPGIGFGKTLAHNLTLLRGLGAFRSLGRPLLIGTSRKSFLGQILEADMGERLEGGLASAVLAVSKGAHIVRTHDVAETCRALQVTDAILRADGGG